MANLAPKRKRIRQIDFGYRGILEAHMRKAGLLYWNFLFSVYYDHISRFIQIVAGTVILNIIILAGGQGIIYVEELILYHNKVSKILYEV